MSISAEQFETILAALAEKIDSQQLTISLQGYEINNLKAKLEAGEKAKTEKAKEVKGE